MIKITRNASLIRLAMAIVVLMLFIGTVEATTIEQIFYNSWSVNVYQGNWYDYPGPAAREWQYQPYTGFDNSLGTLDSVQILTQISLSNATLGDTFRYRLSFFTGWMPADYQAYTDEWFYDIGTGMQLNREWNYSAPNLTKWTNPLYGTDGHYYFESTTFNASHTINVETRLQYDYTPVPEPSTMFFLVPTLIGLLGLSRKFKN